MYVSHLRNYVSQITQTQKYQWFEYVQMLCIHFVHAHVVNIMCMYVRMHPRT